MVTPLIWAEIDLGAVAHNVRALRRMTKPGARLMAVVKADGYGHGAVAVARTALDAGADWLGVARIAEGIGLRAAGIEAPILVFGFTAPADTVLLIEHDLRQSVTSFETAAAYSAAAAGRGRSVRVHLKIDTGMGRLGLLPAALTGPPDGDAAGEGLLSEVGRIVRLPGIEAEGIFTHFAASDSADKTHAGGQMTLFRKILDRLAAAGHAFAVRHAANSAAVIDIPDSHLDLVRPGIALYGLAPSAEVDGLRLALEPAMALKTRVIHLKKVPAGFAVSYGMTYRTPQPTVIATVPAGYADGLRRALSGRGEMIVRGCRVPVVGRVCMDLTMLDVGRLPEVQIGDEVVIIGRQGRESVTADDIARSLGTINYEVVTALTARVARVYRDSRSPAPA
jgi:alanine racemase